MEQLLQELREKGITDERVMAAMSAVDRRDFVSSSFRDCAYRDMPISIGCGQTISQPTIVGLMTQLLDVRSNHRVFEVGTGSGFQTVILSQLARHVYTTERVRSLFARARELITSKYHRQNISFLFRDGALGLAEAAPFDRIIITAASTEVPRELLAQLKDGGIMVLPVATTEWEQRLVTVRKSSNELEYKEICSVRFVPLVEGIRDV
ncbi:MAG: protein-L-isoaspartate(D-aspartate) O-methyltransferase [Rhodobacteraceae bacterium]|nr:protein-L-isoaspartate(D-aspartate) O-methyltransferase [Paracoccaceae bacterium]